LLISTLVFENLVKPYFGAGVEINDYFRGGAVSFKTSEDEFFCRKLRDIDVDVYVNTQDLCEHYCNKQKLFFPSLNKLEDDGGIAQGNFFDVWLNDGEGEIKNE